ncbi:hypothetical protein FQZ97_864060 [compost metagenome]
MGGAAARRALRHHDVRQGLPGHAPGAVRPGPLRGRLPAHWRAPVQGGDGLAAGVHRHAALRGGPGRDPGRRGKAPGAGIPAEGGTVQLDRQRQEDPACGRQVRRQGRRRMVGAPGQLAAAGALRVLARHGRARDRRADPALRSARGRARRHRGAPGLHWRARTGAGPSARRRRAQALVLFGLSAQHLDPPAGGLAGHGGHRLPLHGQMDGPQHGCLHADGRRRRALGGAGAVHRGKARVRQPGRRHLFSFGPAGDPRGGGGQGAHHLQDPVQRRRGDDGRAAGGWPAQRADDQPPDGGRGHRQDRRRDRRAREVQVYRGLGAGRAGEAPRRAGRGDARAA